MTDNLFFTNSVGFERLFTLLNQKHANTFPPYNLVKLDEDTYVISFALAGFSNEDIDLTVKDNVLTISGNVNDKHKNLNYVHKGIATRQFKNVFELDKYLEVKEAVMQDGLLHIHLKREVPEEAKVKKISILSKGSPNLLT